jgi:hypothetical protein
MAESSLSNPAEVRKQAIQRAIKKLMDRVMYKVMVKDPFLPDKHKADKPLYAALVPNEIFKGSHFERRFVTPFGHVWEELAIAAATHDSRRATTNHMITGVVRQERLRRIAEVLDRLEHAAKGEARTRPDWDAELAYVLAGEGPEIPVHVICDVYVEDTTESSNGRLAFELKAPLPNSDQTKVSKEKLLKLYSMDPIQIDGAFYALPYNPYGRKEDYAWSFPARWFNMKKDRVVLIGDEFWEKLGGFGTYQAFITAVNELGKVYRDRIYREYLGIEAPPESDAQARL